MRGTAISSCSENIPSLLQLETKQYWQNGTKAANTDVKVFQTSRTTAGRVNFSEVAEVSTYNASVMSRGHGN